jgi:hypothetical protein
MEYILLMEHNGQTNELCNVDLQDRERRRTRKKVEGFFVRQNGPEALTGVSDDLKQESG